MFHKDLQPPDPKSQQEATMHPATRITTALCLAAAVLFTVGCGSSTPPPEEAATTTASAQPVQVDENLLTVDVTVMRSMMDPSGELTDERIIEPAKESEMTAVINSDDTVTYTMSRAQQREMLDTMRTSIEQSVAEFVDDPRAHSPQST
ncbi:MAG: hypothetical protein WBL05_02330 [Brooklawnia sp.]|uniref:hypothetical protein n=1 Tax=Brooklawnia sp. TaxID=2699740 RepID=UPI003C7658FC